MGKINSIEDVVNHQLCTGCGICAGVEPERFEMHDVYSIGRRPRYVEDAKPTTGEALKCCPGVSLVHTYDPNDPELDKSLETGWGPVYEVWEAYAADPEVRFNGSSGGAITALSLHAMEALGYGGVSHIGMKKDEPYLNESKISSTKNAVLENCGSRYSPASPCESLPTIIASDKKMVFVGKPCDSAAMRFLTNLKPELNDKVGINIGFFCAGTPSTEGNIDLLKREGIEDKGALEHLRYRGKGWPGLWTAVAKKAGEIITRQVKYIETWVFLAPYRQWRCFICPDHCGEFADVSVGDPWYRERGENEKGYSLIVIRNKKGKEFVKGAVEAGYIELVKEDKSYLPRSQTQLLKLRGSLWGRLLTMRLFGAPIPEFKGFSIFTLWLYELPVKEKIKSFTGTLSRVRRKKLNKKLTVI